MIKLWFLKYMFSFEDVPKIVVIHWLVADTVPQMMDMKACREWTDSISSFPHYWTLPSASMPLSSLCSSWCSLCPWWSGGRCPWWSLDGQVGAVKWELMWCARQRIVIWVTPNLFLSSSSSPGWISFLRSNFRAEGSKIFVRREDKFGLRGGGDEQKKT